MKPLKLISFVLFMVFLQAGLVNALEVHKVSISLQENGNSLVRNLFSIDSTNRTDFFVTLSNPQNVIAYDENGDLNFSFSGGDIFVELGAAAEGYSFTVEYLTDSFTSKNGSEWTLLYNFYKLGDFDNSQLTVTPPSDSSLLSYSSGGIVYLDNNRINIDFDINPNEFVTALEVKYTFSAQPPEPPVQDNNSLLIILIIFGIIISAAIVLFYFFRKSRKSKRPELKEPEKPEPKHKIAVVEKKFSSQQNDILKTLTANEEKTTRELFKHEGGLTQKKLALETGLPKSTLSRTLKKLEAKSIVEIKDYGYTKKVTLTIWFLEK